MSLMSGCGEAAEDSQVHDEGRASQLQKSLTHLNSQQDSGGDVKPARRVTHAGASRNAALNKNVERGRKKKGGGRDCSEKLGQRLAGISVAKRQEPFIYFLILSFPVHPLITANEWGKWRPPRATPPEFGRVQTEPLRYLC